MSAGLPHSQPSNTASIGHWLHRRYHDPATSDELALSSPSELLGSNSMQNSTVDRYNVSQYSATSKFGNNGNDDSLWANETHDARVNKADNLGNESGTQAVSSHSDIAASSSSMRVNPDAPPNLHSIPNIEDQFKAGVLRFSQEVVFFHEFNDAIQASDDPWLMKDNRKDALMTMCSQALEAVKTSGPIEYDILFASFLISTVESNTEDSNLKEALDNLELLIFDFDCAFPLPNDIAIAIARVFNDLASVNSPIDFKHQKVAIYDFLHHTVFGYEIQSTDESDRIIRDL
ncbi:hypothetical protein H4R35_006804, partial [Dimargaris xerosporica]